MDRIIRVGIPDSRLYEAKALAGIRYIRKRNHDIRIARVRMSRDVPAYERLADGTVDMVVTEYDSLNEYDSETSNILTIGLVLPQGDTRDVLVTRKRSHSAFDRAVVECYSEEARVYVENTFDSVSCREAHANDALELNRIISKQCDAAVMSADRIKSLRIDRNRHLKYVFFKNKYERADTKAVWVAAIRRDDEELSGVLMPMSDENTLRKLSK